jgi:hypothetical protein
MPRWSLAILGWSVALAGCAPIERGGSPANDPLDAMPSCLRAALHQASCRPSTMETRICVGGFLEPQAPGTTLRQLVHIPGSSVTEDQLTEFAQSLMNGCTAWTPEGGWSRSPDLVAGPLTRTFHHERQVLQLDVQFLLGVQGVALQITESNQP